MACYHFRLKSDKKPNGMRVSSAEHISYVNREGKYQDADSRFILQTGSYKNTIYGTHPILSLPKKPMLLYSSPFGNIKLDAHGIHVSHGASIETQAIALRTAQKIFGDELGVHGDEGFTRNLLIAERDLQLGAHFSDADLERANEKMQKEREEIEWQRGLAQGSVISARRYTGADSNGGTFGRSGLARIRGDWKSGADGFDISVFQSDTPQSTIETLTQKGLHLHVLPGGNVAHKRRRTHLFLSDDEKRMLYSTEEDESLILLCDGPFLVDAEAK